MELNLTTWVKKHMNPGDVICDQCNSTGSPDNNKNEVVINIFGCEKCDGYGKLDWIENVVGKRRPDVEITYLKPTGRTLKNRWTIL